MNNYGYQQYKEQSINTMTQGELLILLYDEVVKRLSRAELALKNNDIALFEGSMDRVSEIIRHLNGTLDKSYEVSDNLAKLYEFFLFEVARVKAGRNTEVINQIKAMIFDLRNTFKEADKISNLHQASVK